MSVIVRETRETTVRVEIVSDATRIEIATSVPFLDHMLTTLARYMGCGVIVSARGDLRHHIVEDVAIAFGTALAKYAPAFPARYGERTVPMDDALVQCVVDIGGRPYYRGRLPSCALGDIERGVFQIEREDDDVPGWLIPQLPSDNK